MRFCSIFGAVMRKFYLKLRYCGLTKPSVFQFSGFKFSGNFYAVCGFLMLFCAVFIRISVWFCGIRIPLTPPLVRTDDHVECISHEREEKLLTNPILNLQLETVQCWCTHTFVKWLPI